MENKKRLRQVGPMTALTLIELYLEGEFKLTQGELDEMIDVLVRTLERVNNTRDEDPVEVEDDV